MGGLVDGRGQGLIVEAETKQEKEKRWIVECVGVFVLWKSPTSAGV